MKTWKMNVFRLIVFVLVLLAIPFAALHAAAAEKESAFPEEGKYYCICGTWKWNGISREGSLSVTPGTFWEEGKTTLTGVGYDGGEIRDEDKLSVKFSFSFEKTEDGYYKIIPASMPNGCLQLGTDHRGDPDLSVGIYEGKPEQKWRLTLLESGKYHVFNAAYPDAALGAMNYLLYPTINGENSIISFYFVESAIEFPETRIYVKAPAQWHPGIWVHPLEDDVEYSWLREATMEIGSSGWYSYASPSGSICAIANHATKGVGAQTYDHDDVFDLEGIDFSTDKWIVITDDPNVEGDLTYKVYDYNPDEEPLKPDQAYTISIGWGLSVQPEIGLQGTTLMMGGQGDLSFAFYFDKTEDGYYTISPASMPGWRLQLAEDSVIAEKPQDIPEQKWSIVACEDGYTIASAAKPTLFFGKTPPPADYNQESGDFVLSANPDQKVWKITESQLAFSEHSVYVKAPEHWAPGLLGDYGSWCVGLMEKQADGWFSFPLYPYQSEDYRCKVVNYMVTAWSSQSSPPDCHADLYQLEPDKDYWVVITDDPNVDGDLTYQVYDYNPDEPPKTADPVTLALPAFTLLTSAIALSSLLRRRKTA